MSIDQSGYMKNDQSNSRRPNTVIQANKWLYGYFAVEFVLLVAIKIMEFLHLDIEVQYVMYAAILLNTIVAAYYFIRYGRNADIRHTNLIALGLFATCIADVFLTLIGTDETKIPGFACFCIVQVIYLIYLKDGLVPIIIRCVLYAAALVVLYIVGMLDLMYAFGVLDILLILANTISAWRSRRFRSSLLFRIGITLFCLCDVCILFRTLLPGIAHDIAAFFVWTFYIPSQVLIVLAYIHDLNRS